MTDEYTQGVMDGLKQAAAYLRQTAATYDEVAVHKSKQAILDPFSGWQARHTYDAMTATEKATLLRAQADQIENL